MRTKILKSLPPVLLAGTVCWFLFTKPAVCTAGVRAGIQLCGNVVIPSLFVFMTVASFLLNSGVLGLTGHFLEPVTKRLFHLPGVSAGVIFMGLIGGFPVGAKMTAQLLSGGHITQNQAMRMCLFCVNAGPAFVISAVGFSILHSVRAGVILYASTTLATLIMGVLTGVLDDRKATYDKRCVTVRLNGVSKSLTKAVSEAARSMLMICAWVVLFFAVCACVDTLALPQGAKLFLSSILEVTGGVQAAAGHFPIPVLAAILSFAGLSVHCQILSDLQFCGVKGSWFFTARCISAVISAFLCKGLLYFFPCEVSVFATNSAITPVVYSVSVPAFIALIVMSVLLILEVEPNRKVC